MQRKREKSVLAGMPANRAVAMAVAVVVVVGFFAWILTVREGDDEAQPGLSVWVIDRLTIGHSIEGRALICQRVGEGGGGVLFLGSIHGSEGAGTPLLEALVDHLKREGSDGLQVDVVAAVNPDGLARNRRLNQRDVDLNRNFPARNRREQRRFGAHALSEPESQAIHQLIEETQPRVVVTIHQPLGCVDYDGPPSAEQLAQVMAESCGLPVRKLGSRPGSLGAYFGESLGRPIITLELPRLAPDEGARLWRRYGPALLKAIAPPSP